MIVASGVSRTTGGSMRHQWPAVLCSVLALTIVTVGAQTPAKPAGKTYKAPRTAWGDPDISGQLHQQVRAGHAVRAAARARGPAPRRHRRRGTVEDSQSASDQRHRAGAIQRRRSRGTASAGPPSSATTTRSLKGSSRVVRRRSAGRQDSADDARGAAAHPRGAPRQQQLRQRALQRPGRLQPLRSLHHARVPGFDDARPSTATRTRSCRARAAWASATR